MRSIRLTLFLTLVTGLLARSASADVVMPYDGGGFCFGENVGAESHLSRGLMTNGRNIKNKTDGPGETPQDVKIYCGIIKYTSGPSNPNDKIKTVATNFLATHSGTQCQVNVWQGDLSGTNGPSLPDHQAASITSTGSFTVYADTAGNATGYWGADNNGAWKYAILGCTLKPGDILSDYTVTEQGDYQNHLIFSAPTQMPTSTSASGGYSHCITTSDANDFGGCFEGEVDGATWINSLQIVPNGLANIQVMVGPSISAGGYTQMQCTFENVTKVAPQNGSPSSPQDFPAKILSFNRTDVYQQRAMDCGTFRPANPLTSPPTPAIPDASGDGKVLSFRMF